MITTNDFRDTRLTSITFSYNWDTSVHYAEIHVVGYDGVRRAYRLTHLMSYALYDELDASVISHCTFISAPDRVYLSLDPYLEGEESEKDNLVFIAKGVEVVNVR